MSFDRLNSQLRFFYDKRCWIHSVNLNRMTHSKQYHFSINDIVERMTYNFFSCLTIVNIEVSQSIIFFLRKMRWHALLFRIKSFANFNNNDCDVHRDYDTFVKRKSIFIWIKFRYQIVNVFFIKIAKKNFVKFVNINVLNLFHQLSSNVSHLLIRICTKNFSHVAK